jgi:hypothetical protein
VPDEYGDSPEYIDSIELFPPALDPITSHVVPLSLYRVFVSEPTYNLPTVPAVGRADNNPDVADGVPPPFNNTKVPLTSGTSKKLKLPKTGCGIGCSSLIYYLLTLWWAQVSISIS